MENKQKEELIKTLKIRFEEHMERHPSTAWETVETSLDDSKLAALAYMEETGGEPDVVEFEKALYYFDCSRHSPMRRSLCYDKEARIKRKKNAPASSAEEEADAHGLSLLTEAQYMYLQSLGKIDETSSSWIETEPGVRKEGGALFGNYHYGRAFIYHNGADSYYAARGFRGCIRL